MSDVLSPPRGSVTPMSTEPRTATTSSANRRRVMCLSMFWHFLDVVWVAVFSFVYLVGSLS